MLKFASLSESSRPVLTVLKTYIPGLPVVAFRFSEAFRSKYPDVSQKWIQTLLRSKAWIVPNYELAPDLSDVEILRVVVRETVSEVLIERLITDIASHPGTVLTFHSPPILQIDITESLTKADTPAHALNALGNTQVHGKRHEIHHGKLEEGSASKSSGTYAKQC